MCQNGAFQEIQAQVLLIFVDRFYTFQFLFPNSSRLEVSFKFKKIFLTIYLFFSEFASRLNEDFSLL